jgi:hypothetical protein
VLATHTPRTVTSQQSIPVPHSHIAGTGVRDVNQRLQQLWWT